jgi:uncharacterized protein YqgC (DUF456 family)
MDKYIICINTVTYLLFLVGICGCFLPVIPGLLLIWLGVLIHKVCLLDGSVSWYFFIVTTLLAGFAQLLDLVFTYWGVKRFGGTWRGIVGAMLGIIIGIFCLTPILGLIVGPVLGATVGELMGGKNFRAAGKAGIGTLVATFLAFLTKFIIACIIIISFFLLLPEALVTLETFSL